MSINKILDHDIKTIKRDIEKMVIETKKQYEKTYEVIKTQNYELAEEVVKGDKKINDMQNDFTAMALWKIAKQQMVAGDLRLAVGSIEISREIERIADYAKNLCRFYIEYKPQLGVTYYIQDTFYLIVKMLDTIMVLFDHFDVDLSSKVREFEQEVNEEFSKAQKETVVKIRQSESDGDALMLYTLLRQLKNLERAGDHIISIQEILNFIRTGKYDDVDKFTIAPKIKH